MKTVDERSKIDKWYVDWIMIWKCNDMIEIDRVAWYSMIVLCKLLVNNMIVWTWIPWA